MLSTGEIDDEARTSEIPWLLVWLIVVHVLFGLLGLLWRVGPGWPIALLWAGACAIVGSTIGFLFGIPRTLQGEQQTLRGTLVRSKRIQDHTAGQQSIGNEAESLQATSDDAHYQLRVNTNLEQISDWLTKILVGVGLTQLSQLRGSIMRAAAFIAKGIGGDTVQTTALCVAMLVYFPVLGFLSGYLCTRLFLQPAFRRWDQGLKSK